jgi:hypothetical protein
MTILISLLTIITLEKFFFGISKILEHLHYTVMQKKNYDGIMKDERKIKINCEKINETNYINGNRLTAVLTV